MIMADSSEKNNNADMFETPGQVLRTQRESLKLSTKEIAKRIHLDVKIIESIENDDHEGLPSAIYVRGYLRSYAKVVDADADKIIELYNTDSPPPPEILPEVKQPTQVSSNDKPVKAFTYLLTLGLVLLLLIWYQSNFVVSPHAKDKQLNTETHINGVEITYPIITHPESWQSPKVQEKIANESFNIEPATELLLITNDVAKLQADENKQAIEAATAKTTSNNSSLSILGERSDLIEIEITADSWIEIYDKKNKRLFHRLARAGNQYKIKGIAPLTVLLGFSSGVTIKYNGKPFDITPHSKAGVARFILSE